MARYNIYVSRIETNLETGSIKFYFSNGNFLTVDSGELAEIISKAYPIGDEE